MKKIVKLFGLFGIIAIFAGCVYDDIPQEFARADDVSEITETAYLETTGVPNFVDTRFELVSLLARLAGRPEYSDVFTEYQQLLAETFAEFADHHAVYMARELSIHYDFVFNISFHLYRDDSGLFVFQDDIQMMVNRAVDWGMFEEEAFLALVPLFLEALNQFYIDTGFRDFLAYHEEYFLQHSAMFYNNVYSRINFEWFEQFGTTREQMTVMIAPSGSRNGFGGWRYGLDGRTYTYAGMPSHPTYEGFFHQFVIHEFAHSIANPIADVWYEEKEEFYRWSNDSLDLVRFPAYSVGLIMGYEYVTRAYTILYMVENHEVDLVPLLFAEILGGFPYIEHVYAMITDHEIIGFNFDSIGGILGAFGIDYTLGEERIFNFEDGDVLRWQAVILSGAEGLGNIIASMPPSTAFDGDILGTGVGDVVYAHFGGQRLLLVDISEGTPFGMPGARVYSAIPLND
ncbi:MAG: DUF4932 domain-containing protein [Defluviitaleaceae bacterium]|nr:DUF4932 domain-containing protein [Defluviitaleaceae bacterium]